MRISGGNMVDIRRTEQAQGNVCRLTLTAKPPLSTDDTTSSQNIAERPLEAVPASTLEAGVTESDLQLVLTAASFQSWKEVDPRLQKIRAFDTLIRVGDEGVRVRLIECKYQNRAIVESAKDLLFEDTVYIFRTATAAASCFRDLVKNTTFRQVMPSVDLIYLGDERFRANTDANAAMRNYLLVRKGRVVHILFSDGINIDRAEVMNSLFDSVLRKAAELGTGE